MSPKSKVTEAVKIYRNNGIKALVGETYEYLLHRGPTAPHIKRVLGENLHQKLLLYPRVGYWPQIKQPRSFNEKLLNRKLYTNNHLFATVEDKWKVREYVQERIAEDILPEVYHITNDPQSISLQSLPNEFVVKPTHLSGPINIVDDKAKICEGSLKNQCRKWLNKRHGTISNEYWYGQIKPQIVIEERLSGTKSDIPRDFKFFVFHGSVEYIQVDIDRYTNHSRRFYNRNWEPQEFKLEYPLGPETSKPSQLENMVEIAETLGSEFEFIRVDLYETNNSEVKFGELTVAPESGSGRFDPVNYDFVLGLLW